MKFDIKAYLDDNSLTIYRVAKASGYGYTTIHKSFNKTQSDATSLNVRDLDALAKAQNKAMWEVLRDLENFYFNPEGRWTVIWYQRSWGLTQIILIIT